MQSILAFDVLSHEFMHHPFNEAYLRLLRAAFPDDRVIFHAHPAHLRHLAPRFATPPLTGTNGIAFRPCPSLAIPFGLSRHNPLAGRLAAWRCWRRIAAHSVRQPFRMAAVLGVDANLLAVLRRTWPDFSPAPLHLILHNHLAAASTWRSRNPLIRGFDFIAGLQRPLPPPVRLVALELGIAEAVAELAPAIAPALDTLEHPILHAECAEPPRPTDRRATVLSIGFLGHASRDKGFALFADIARAAHGPQRSFHAIGMAAPDAATLDLSGLARRPDPAPTPRADYTASLAALDLVCLPLSPAYQYVASGSVIDAIAALKPLACLRNRSLDAITARHGPIGYLANSEAELAAFIRGLTPAGFAARREEWVRNLRAIRAARLPQVQGPRYAATIARAALVGALLAGPVPFAAAPFAPARAATLEVGPGRAFDRPAAAARVARDGDIIMIDPGDYYDCAVWTANRLIIASTGFGSGTDRGVVITDTTCEGKALFILRGNDTTIRGLTFARARVPDRNGAGIRAEGGSVTVEASRFVNNETGLLAAGRPGMTVRVIGCDFIANGVRDLAGPSPALSAGPVALLRVERSRFVDSRGGAHILSAAARTELVANRIEDGETGGRDALVVLTAGGALDMAGNRLRRAPNLSPVNAAVRAEGGAGALSLRGNTLVNVSGRAVALLLDWTPGGTAGFAANALAPGDVERSTEGAWRHQAVVAAHGLYGEARQLAAAGLRGLLGAP